MHPLSKHGTLGSADLVDVREVDLSQIFSNGFAGSTSHLFGKVGAPPPDSAVVMERRYTKVWSLEGEHGTNYVALNKLNSSHKGKFSIDHLSPGMYKLVVRILKTDTTLISLATKPVGAIMSNVHALVAGGDTERRDQVLARGMPTEFVQMSCEVSTRNSLSARTQVVLTVDKEELDQSRDEVTKMFTIKDVDDLGYVTLQFTSYSLIKRMRVACDLYRCDLPSQVDLARQGRHLMNRALQQQQQGKKQPPPPPPPPPAVAKQKMKRSVPIDYDTDVWTVLRDFYAEHCPEKAGEISQIVDYFYTRDGHLGVLFATLEDKYGVKFQPNGQWA